MDEQVGYIPIFRKFFDHYLWDEEREFSKAEAWIDCIQMARYKKTKKKKLIGGNLIEWGYGQFPASIRFLRNRWGWGSNSKVSNFLSLLESDNMIKVSNEQGQNIVTLCNYDTYDIKNGMQKDSEKTQIEQVKDTAKTDSEQNSKKGKKGNKEKNYIPTLSEVKDYFSENGYDHSIAEKAFNYYQESVNGTNRKYWRDSKGNMIKNWKMKMRAVWFKEQNKTEPEFNPAIYEQHYGASNE